MQRSIIVNVSQDDNELSVKSDYTAFEMSCNSCNSDS